MSVPIGEPNVTLQMPFGDNLQQAVTQAQSNFADLMRQGTQAYWEQQKQLLNAMESLANGWFERRRVGVQDALEAAERICQATTPPACLGECQKWAAGALERVMADGAAFQSELGKLVQGVAPPLTVAVSGSQQAGAETETRKRARVSEAA